MKYQLNKSSIYIEGTDIPKKRELIALHIEIVEQVKQYILTLPLDPYRSFNKNRVQYFMINFVGRVVLIPTPIQTTKQFYFFIKALCANVFADIEHLIYVNLCRDGGDPTYRILNNKIYKDNNHAN